MRRLKISADMAYLLGLFYADGSFNNGQAPIIKQAEENRDALQVLYRRLPSLFTSLTRVWSRSKTPQGRTYEGWTWNLHFPRSLRLWLQSVEAKSAGVLDHIPAGHFHHFVRGFLDGDGSSSTTISRKKLAKGEPFRALTFQVDLPGTETFLQALRGRLQEVGLRPTRVYSAGSFHKVIFNGRHALQLCEWLYKDDGRLCIRRKRAKYLRFKHLVHQYHRYTIPLPADAK